MILFQLSTHQVIPNSSPFEAFHIGFICALSQRLIGYRIVKFQILILFQIALLILRMLLSPISNPIIITNTIFLEVFTMLLSYTSERAERSLVHILYKSKDELLKFKHLLASYLPNQIAIFAKDRSSLLFANNAFKKDFECENITAMNASLENFIVDHESIEKNALFLESLGHSKNDQASSLNLSEIISLLAKNIDKVRDHEFVSFQVSENNLVKVLKDIDPPRNAMNSKIPPTTVQSIPIDPVRNVDEIAVNIPGGRFETYNKFETSYTSSEDKKFHLSTQPQAISTFKEDSNSPDNLTNNMLKKYSKHSSNRIFKVKVFVLTWDTEDALAIMLDDMTYERTLMELKIADKNKDLVIATVSHEFRTPVNVILGFLRIICQTVKQADVLPYLEGCKSSAHLLLNLVNSILDLSQIRNNKLRLVYSRFCLTNLLNYIYSLFGYLCREKGLYLNIDVAPNVQKYIVTDQNRLSQVLINVLSNALKFTFKGGITLKVENSEHNLQKLKFSIQDTGIGIKDEDQDKLFRLFGRLDSTNNINPQGVGLGLTISQQLVTALNSSEQSNIQLSSKVDVGSTFSFHINYKNSDSIKEDLSSVDNEEELNTMLIEDSKQLPSSNKLSNYVSLKPKTLNDCSFYKQNPDLTFKPSSATTLNQTSQQPINYPKTIDSSKNTGFVEATEKKSQENQSKEKSWCLVVDDHPFNVMMAKAIMEERGYNVKTALNGKEAIERAKEHQEEGQGFRVILMDCQMPVMNGYEATKELKEMMKEGRINKSPIIAITANDRAEDHRKAAQDAGMDGFLGKPLVVHKVEAIVDDWRAGGKD